MLREGAWNAHRSNPWVPLRSPSGEKVYDDGTVAVGHLNLQLVLVHLADLRIENIIIGGLYSMRIAIGQ